jgi:hypothetical protein
VIGGKGGESLDPVRFGVYRTAEEWHEAAKLLDHPGAVSFSDDPEFLAAVQSMFGQSRASTKKMRDEVIAHYTGIRDKLASEEEKLHASMDPVIRPVMEGKCILLLRTMLADFGIPGDELCRRLTNGFELTGMLPSSGIFKPQFKPPVTSMRDFWKASKWSQGLYTLH